MSDIGDDLPTPTGPELGATFDFHLERFLSARDPVEREAAAHQVRLTLDLLLTFAAPVLAYERAILASESHSDGEAIDTWSLQDVETDSAKAEAVRRVTAQLLIAHPGLLAGHHQEGLALALSALSQGTVRPLLKPPSRPRGGASDAIRGRKDLLGRLFWMRKGWDGSTTNAAVETFSNASEYDARSVRRIVSSVPKEDRHQWEMLGAARAGRPVPSEFHAFVTTISPDKVPNPTDENIRAIASWGD